MCMMCITTTDRRKIEKDSNELSGRATTVTQMRVALFAGMRSIKFRIAGQIAEMKD